MNEYVVADTAVVCYLTNVSKHSRAYYAAMGDRRLAVSFQTPPELFGVKYSKARQKRLEGLLAVMLELPHRESTNFWYARVAEKRQQLRKGGQQLGSGASEADVWIVSSALEYGFPLLSHDKQQVALGRAADLKVWTNLEELRDDNPDLT